MRHVGEASELLLQAVEVGGARPAQGLQSDDLAADCVVDFVDDTHAAGARAGARRESDRCRRTAVDGLSRPEVQWTFEKRVRLLMGGQRGGSRPSEVRDRRRTCDPGRCRARTGPEDDLVEDRPQALMALGRWTHGDILLRTLSTAPYTASNRAEQPGRITTRASRANCATAASRRERSSSPSSIPSFAGLPAHYIRQERPDHTLRTTGLVNEMYVRLFGATQVDWQSRAHFFAAVAREMRHILVDYARARDAKKRPDPRLRISLSDVGATVVADASDEDVVALDEALSRLEAVDPRASRVVELRYFTGLSEREAAEALGVSLSTLKRDWTFAKAWLLDQLQSGPAPDSL